MDNIFYAFLSLVYTYNKKKKKNHVNDLYIYKKKKKKKVSIKNVLSTYQGQWWSIFRTQLKKKTKTWKNIRL